MCSASRSFGLCGLAGATPRRLSGLAPKIKKPRPPEGTRLTLALPPLFRSPPIRPARHSSGRWHKRPAPANGEHPASSTVRLPAELESASRGGFSACCGHWLAPSANSLAPFTRLLVPVFDFPERMEYISLYTVYHGVCQPAQPCRPRISALELVVDRRPRGTFGASFLSRLPTVKPSRPGSITSSTIRSACAARSAASGRPCRKREICGEKV